MNLDRQARCHRAAVGRRRGLGCQICIASSARRAARQLRERSSAPGARAGDLRISSEAPQRNAGRVSAEPQGSPLAAKSPVEAVREPRVDRRPS